MTEQDRGEEKVEKEGEIEREEIGGGEKIRAEHSFL